MPSRYSLASTAAVSNLATVPRPWVGVGGGRQRPRPGGGWVEECVHSPACSAIVVAQEWPVWVELQRRERDAGVGRVDSLACVRHLRSVVVSRMLAESSRAGFLRVRHCCRPPLSCLPWGVLPCSVLGVLVVCAPALFGSRGLGCVALHRAVRLIASAAGPCHGAGARRFIAAPHRGSRICMTTGRDGVSRTMLS